MTDLADDFLCEWACQVLDSSDQLQGLDDWSPSHSSFDCAARESDSAASADSSPTATCSPTPPSPTITYAANSPASNTEQQATASQAALTLIQAFAAQQQQSQQQAACAPMAVEPSPSTAQSNGSLSQALAAIASQQPSRPGKRGRKPFPRLPDLQQKLDDLKQQHRNLTSENVFLKNKLKVLERVVPLRDEAVNSLSAAVHPTPASTPAAEAQAAGTAPSADRPVYPPLSPTPSGESGGSWPGAAPAADEARQEEVATSSGRPCASAACSVDESARSGNRRAVACSGLDTAFMGLAAFSSVSTCGASLGFGRELARQSSPRPSCGTAPCGVQQHAASLVALCPGLDGEAASLASVSADELRHATPDQCRGLWRHVCMQLGVLVTGAEVHGPGSAPAVRLERYVQRLGCFMDKLALLAPSSLMDSMYTSVESGLPERPNDGFWLTCARSLQLSQQQVSELAALSAYHSGIVAPLVQQRMHVAAQLTLRATPPPGAAACAGQDELVQQLASTVEKEHAACRDLSDYVRTSVLTPLQVAKLTTAAFPLIPDWVALLHAVEQHLNSFAVPAAMATGQAAASAAGIAALASLLSAARQNAAAAAAAPAAAAPRPTAPSVQPAVQLQAFLAALQAQQVLARAAA
ncbi:hypothetical protein HXX76_001456 [Chlamydomonas incerta]|uniref:Uncharacterized protein n=1 Tax=Chlamydomonas incerta TaxID=51695 RepID=A0A836B1G5_CHLIN|nr:hypothetical protein HXX76_001456 [Chlamydomonas incerta]|eukprot:KAG2444712.1 hypothetical protein HXX76_001456 [Chlamydomonas incerta]